MGLPAKLGILSPPRYLGPSVLQPEYSDEVELDRLRRDLVLLRKLAVDAELDDQAFRAFARMLLGRPPES